MDTNIRKAALRAAAKTAIALSLSGATLGLSACTSSHTPPTSDAAMVELADAAVVELADAALHDAAVPRPDAASPECDALLGSLELIGTEDFWTTRFASEEAKRDVRTGECCMELEARAAETGTEGIDPAIGMACCEVIVSVQRLQSFSNLGCTPWGPPCPPEAPV